MQLLSCGACGVLLFGVVACANDDSSDGVSMPDGGKALLDAGNLRDGSVDTDGGARTCAALPVSECTSNSACVPLNARRIDEPSHCFLNNSAVGCMSRQQGCTTALTLARDPDGGLWQFSSGCLPGGWTVGPISEDGMLYASSPPPSWTALCQTFGDAGLER